VSDGQCIILRGKVAVLALNNAFPKIILPSVAKGKSATNDQTCYNVKQNCHSFKDRWEKYIRCKNVFCCMDNDEDIK